MTKKEVFEELEKAFVEFSKGCIAFEWSFVDDKELLEAVYAFMQGWDEIE